MRKKSVLSVTVSDFVLETRKRTGCDSVSLAVQIMEKTPPQKPMGMGQRSVAEVSETSSPMTARTEPWESMRLTTKLVSMLTPVVTNCTTITSPARKATSGPPTGRAIRTEPGKS